jgi:hypothetical protein
MNAHPLEKQTPSGGQTPGTPNQPTLEQSRAMLMSQIQRSANWFYIIAGLTLVNSALYLSGTSFSFIVGLAYTQFVDAIAKIAVEKYSASSAMAFGVALLVDAVIAGVFGLFGYFGRKGYRWAFIVGMILYGIDAVIMLAVQDFLSAAFHAFALFNLFNGARAVGLVDKVNQQLKAMMPY